MYFETTSDKVSPDFATDILSHAIDERLTSASESRLIVIELEIFRDKGTQPHEVAPVVGVEQRAIETGDGSEKRVARLRNWRRLRLSSATHRGKTCCET